MEPKKKLEQTSQYDTSTLNEPKPLERCSSNTTTMSTLGTLVNTEADQLESQINSMMTITEKRLTYGNRTKAVFLCNVCGKEGTKTNIVSHIEANHITSNVSYSCDLCGKTSRSRDGLRFHKRSQHPKFPGPKTAWGNTCFGTIKHDSCSRTKSALRMHKNRTHSNEKSDIDEP